MRESTSRWSQIWVEIKLVGNLSTTHQRDELGKMGGVEAEATRMVGRDEVQQKHLIVSRVMQCENEVLEDDNEGEI